MGFLSAYSKTKTINIGGGYWIEVKECLSASEKQKAERVMATATMNLVTGENVNAQIDHVAYRNEMVCASIVDWNLDEDDGTVWALAPEPVKRANVGRLPGPVFDMVHEIIDELNAPRERDEQVRFPDAGVVGGPDGHGGTAVDVDVQPPAEPVAAGWDAPGGPGVPALA